MYGPRTQRTDPKPVNNIYSPHPPARVLSATPSRFWLIGWLIDWMMWTDHTLCACAHFDFSGLELFASTMSLQLSWKRTCRYEWNEREISQVQVTTPSSEAAWTKTNKPCLWKKLKKLGREAWKHREQSRRRLKKQTRKHRRGSKLNGSEGCASRRQCQTAEQKLAGCWIKAKVCSPPCKCGLKQQQRPNQQQKYLQNQHLRLQRHFKLSV